MDERKKSASTRKSAALTETDFLQGYSDYYSGFEVTTCPFHELGRAQNWKAGWFSAEDEDNKVQ
ncbi:hypothetical protein [Chromatium okenii]|jgi:ribosome modulation factor|uniref:hypothetical protein n=1 Tax=Chromatium okenii TaxID=61644 RepID=UPI0026EBA203|nr:hypothetical protein [Chromatium okenii]MBV5310890.1 hypothetical protein [Chromatium okenii]